MKRFLHIIILILISTRALAFDNGTVEIRVTINKPPLIDRDNFKPSNGSTMIEGETLEISVEATDPNNDILQYQFIVNDKVKQPWSADPTYNYILKASDTGINNIKVEVTDGIETKDQEVEIYIFRSPIAPPQ